MLMNCMLLLICKCRWDFKKTDNKIILQKKKPFHPGRPSETPASCWDRTNHFIEKIPPTRKKAKPTRRCAVCCKRTGKRKETSFWCQDCKVGLCLKECFKIYHTQAIIQKQQGKILTICFLQLRKNYMNHQTLFRNIHFY